MQTPNLEISSSVRPSVRLSPALARVGFIGSYCPRKCGIATFTTDLCRAVGGAFPATGCEVVAINDPDSAYDYDRDVRFQVAQQDLSAYRRAAAYLNGAGVEVVCLQHEFGVYGGDAGGHILSLLAELKAPVITTLHTVLTHPNEYQSWVMRELIARSKRLVVMTRHTRQLLCERYQAPPEKVEMIAHGIPDTAWSDTQPAKKRLGLDGHRVVLTFGLLSPGKGIEDALRGVAAVVPQCPDLVYVILGATHPHVVREQGENYRKSLEKLAEDLGIADNVQFHNRFVDLAELTEFIAAADVYVTPYLNEAQAVSGTLAYAFGCGKPVVSTPYWHAKELLEDDRGILVPFANSLAIAEALRQLLLDDDRRQRLGERAYLSSRGNVWSQVARQYMRTFQAAAGA